MDSDVRLGDGLTALHYAEHTALGFPSPPAPQRLAPKQDSQPQNKTRTLGVPLAEPPDPAVPAGSTVAPRKALSRWLCCLASCSSVSSRRMRWSRSCCSDFCHFLLWVWASIRKSRQACGQRPVSAAGGRGAGLSPPRPRQQTHVDHGVGGDAEERGALVHLLDLLGALGGQPEGLQLAEGALQGRAVLGDQVVAGAQVLHLARQGAQRALQLRLVRLRHGLIAGVVCRRDGLLERGGQHQCRGLGGERGRRYLTPPAS